MYIMKCQNCNHENSANDKYCGNCGTALGVIPQSVADYEEEIRRFDKEQAEAKKLEKTEDLDLESPTGLLKAQLRMLISIYRRVEKLESRGKQKTEILDFHMPFWSLVGFLFKLFFANLFVGIIILLVLFLINLNLAKAIFDLFANIP